MVQEDRGAEETSEVEDLIPTLMAATPSHAARHTYVSRVVESGASVKTCQELARHSDPTLTIGR